MLLGVVEGVVIFAVGEEEVEERVGETEMEEWDTYGTPNKFLSSSSLCLLGGLSACLPKAVCVSVCVCVPCVFVLPSVSATSVCASTVSD